MELRLHSVLIEIPTIFLTLSTILPKRTQYYPRNNNAQNSVAAAILGGYFGLFILIKIKGAISGGKSVEEEPAPVAVAVPSRSVGAIPDVDSEDFGSFLESEENVMKLVESFEK